MRDQGTRQTIRDEAADLLACLASQPTWRWECYTAPGFWSNHARYAARLALPAMGAPERRRNWREYYAEAEARLRGAQT